MRDFTRQAIGAAVGAIALGWLGVGSATAADFVPPGAEPPPPPEYYGNSQEYDDGYAYRPPAPIYAYPPAPYYYAPRVAVLPAPYYVRRYPRVYGRPVYAARGHVPYRRYYRGRHW